jgi:hypothetical protein
MKKFEIKNSTLYHNEYPKFSCGFIKRIEGHYDAINIEWVDDPPAQDFMLVAKVLRLAGEYYAAYLAKHTPPTN